MPILVISLPARLPLEEKGSADLRFKDLLSLESCVGAILRCPRKNHGQANGPRRSKTGILQLGGGNGLCQPRLKKKQKKKGKASKEEQAAALAELQKARWHETCEGSVMTPSFLVSLAEKPMRASTLQTKNAHLFFVQRHYTDQGGKLQYQVGPVDQMQNSFDGQPVRIPVCLPDAKILRAVAAGDPLRLSLRPKALAQTSASSLSKVQARVAAWARCTDASFKLCFATISKTSEA